MSNALRISANQVWGHFLIFGGKVIDLKHVWCYKWQGCFFLIISVYWWRSTATVTARELTYCNFVLTVQHAVWHWWVPGARYPQCKAALKVKHHQRADQRRMVLSILARWPVVLGRWSAALITVESSKLKKCCHNERGYFWLYISAENQ